MLVTPHIAAGAAIGSTVRRTGLCMAAAFASHFVLDYVPHLDSHALFGVTGGPTTRPEALAAITDTLVGVALLLWLVHGRPRRRIMIAAAFCAVLIDLVDNVPPWGAWFRGWAGTAWLDAYHHSLQHNVAPSQWVVGFGTQVAVIAVSVWMVSRRARKEGAT